MLGTMRKIVACLFSFEALFVLFLFAGRYKTDPRFAFVPFDLTAFFFVASLALGFVILVQRRFTFRRETAVLIGLAATFVTYAVVSLLWTPGYNYASEKALFLATLVFWPLVACGGIIAREPARLRRFVLMLVLFSGWVALESTLAFLALEQGFVRAFEGSYLGLGRILGPGAIVLFIYGFMVAERRNVQVSAIALFVIYMFLLLVIGGRGPLLATLVALLTVFFVAARFKNWTTIAIRKYIKPVGILFLAGGISLTFLASTETMLTVQRFLRILEAGGETSFSVRVDLYRSSLDVWEACPVMGCGVGSWPLVTGREDMKMYPHNMILEVVGEFGLIGLFLLGAVMVYAIWSFARHNNPRQNPWALLVLMLLINTLVNAMVTGDIADNRIVFAALGLMMLRTRQIRVEERR